MSSSNEQLNEIVEQLLGGSIVRVLQENLGIGRESQSKPCRKEVKKTIPGQTITLQNQEDKENAELIPGPSSQSNIVYQGCDSEDSDKEEIHCRKPTARNR